LKWYLRLSLYLLPITALLYQVLYFTQGIRCQTSPNWEPPQYSNKEAEASALLRAFPLHYAGEDGWLYRVSSALLFWESEETSCANAGMDVMSGGNRNGSLALLWPLFLTFCLSQFIETIASALQGRRPVGDINLVELSLAFAEAETMVVKPLDLALDAVLALPRSEAFAFDRKSLLGSLNIAPEMLLISLLWALNNLTSNVMAIFQVRHKYRLINTGFWGIAYLGVFFWSIFRLTYPSWMFRFPTVFLVGFLPHVVVLVGMAACGAIYMSALLLTALSLPPEHGQPASFRARLSAAYRNLQANVHFSTATPLNFRLSDDFYTTLLSTGFTVLTAASEAVYLNEGAKVHVNDLTWLERKRVTSMEQGLLYKKTRSAIPPELRAAANDRIEALSGNPVPSGYSIERTARNQDKDEVLAAIRGDTGMGFLQRGGRFAMALRLIQGTFWLVLGLYAKCLVWTLDKVGIQRRPVWLQNLVGCASRKPERTAPENSGGPAPDNFWMPTADGTYKRMTDLTVDLETEMRTGAGLGSMVYKDENINEERIDEELYGWWKKGGWWGDVDNSGDYHQVSQQDDDGTSMISYATTSTTETPSVADDDEDAWEDSGRRTPTQHNPTGWSRMNHSALSSREATPDPGIDTDRLAALLDPHTMEERNEARMLSRRLRRDGVMTRSQHRREMHQERAAVVASSRFGQLFSLDGLGAPMSEQDEENMLEQFIISTRSKKAQPTAGPSTWDTGAEGMGSSGPQCVVCQDSPRTILLWPCGCLCLCDDCRVNMAARNFASCICCRTTTVAYSRLYVP
jgi:hypothetical protein